MLLVALTLSVVDWFVAMVRFVGLAVIDGVSQMSMVMVGLSPVQTFWLQTRHQYVAVACNCRVHDADVRPLSGVAVFPDVPEYH